MAKFCDKCGTSLPDASAFCLACGSPSAPKLSSPSAPPPAPPPPAPVPVPYPNAAPAPAFQPVQTPAYQPTPQPAYVPPPPPPQPPPQQAYTPPQPPAPPQWSAPPPPQPPQWSAPQPPPPAGYPPPLPAGYPPASAPKSGNTWIKVVIIIVVVVGVLGVAAVGGIWYVSHQVISKVKDAANQAGINTDDLGKESTTKIGDPCRFLSKAEVGDAIGVPITKTESSEAGCSYFAQGTMADMTSKHVAAMLGQRGVDKKSQDMAQQFAGVVGSMQPKSAGEDSDASGNAVVLGVSFQTQSARTQMQLDSKVLGAFGQAGGSSTLTGIGDEASVAADGMLMVRKGDTMVRFMYTSCPCSTEQIKPLAKKVADAL